MTGETHSVRRSAFEKTETTWRIDDDALVTRDHQGREMRDRWADVVAIRIADTPTQYQTWRAILMVTFRTGVKRTVLNSHFRGLGDFENRSATYAPFVRAALAKVQALAPRARARVGAGPVFYWTSVVILGVLMAALAALLMVVPFDELGTASPTMWIRVGILVVLLPILLLWARRSYPRSVPLANFPEDKLPKIA